MRMIRLAIASSGRQAGVEGVADFLLDTDIVVCELAHVGIVNTKNLSFLSGAETEARDEVHDPEDGGLDADM